MKRKEFLGIAGFSSLSIIMNPLSELNKLSDSFKSTNKMPVLFLGHGNPMNAIQDNEYATGFKKVAQTLPKPNAILCISAHWLTRGTYITAMEHPKTIHDFGGFPKELYDVQYNAPGDPELAGDVQKLLKENEKASSLDHDWGLDHGTWSVIMHLYPEANIPVIQLSLDYYKPPQYHYEIARTLNKLRSKGVLIVGSGNIVHNLRAIDFDHRSEKNFGHDWAHEARNTINSLIMTNDHKALIDYQKLGEAVQKAIPTPDHYLPLLYSLGLKQDNEDVTLFNDKLTDGSISMTSLKIS